MIDVRMLIEVLINGILIGAIYSLVAVGLSLVFGVVGLVNFAHGEFLMVGMYTTYWLVVLFSTDLAIATLVTCAFLFLVGALTQRFVFYRALRQGLMAQFLVTVGLMLVLPNVVLAAWKGELYSLTMIIPYAGSSIDMGGMMIGFPRLISLVTSLAATSILYVFLRSTKLGCAIRATAQNSNAAACLGINTPHIYMIAVGIGFGLAGIAGSVLTTFQSIFPTVGSYYTITAFLAVILGGLGSISGAFVAGFIIGIAESFGATYVATQYKELVTFVLFIFIILFRPEGILGERVRRM